MTVSYTHLDVYKRQDLAKPEFKGKVVMPNPNSSGTGFLDVSAWMQRWGDTKAWKYMDGLHEIIAQYTHSGSKPVSYTHLDVYKRQGAGRRGIAYCRNVVPR